MLHPRMTAKGDAVWRQPRVSRPRAGASLLFVTHPPSPIAAGVVTRGLEREGPADQDQDLAEVSSMCVAFRVVCQTG